MRGLYVPQFTAFTSDFAVDFKATKDHGAWLIENGVSGLVPFGTFGEGASLSLAEKQRVTLDLLEIKKNAALIPTLICNSLGEILEYLKFAEDLPIDGVMVIPPSYFKPVTDTMLADFYKRICAATKHRVIAYNIPATSLKISAELASSIPVWGVKDSSGDITSAENYFSKNVKVLVGSDSLLAQAIKKGANGGICGIGNFFPRQMVQVYQLSTDGAFDQAEELIARIMNAVAPVLKPEFGFVEAIGSLKSLAAKVIPTGLGDMRTPVPTHRPTDSEINEALTRISYL